MRQVSFRRLVITGVAVSTLLGGAGIVSAPQASALPSNPGEFDHVLYWNDVLLDAFREVGGPPTTLSRAGAMMHAAIYDAVNSIEPIGEPYIAVYPLEPDKTYRINGNIDLAAATILRQVFPSVNVDEELAEALRDAGTGPVPANPAFLGDLAAKGVIDARRNDGSANDAPYLEPITIGQWRPTGSGPAKSPNWGLVEPFGIQSGSQFRPELPGGFSSVRDLLPSDEYTAQFEDVRLIGDRESATRTDEEEDIAFFWANDLDGTYKTPGQLFTHTAIVAEQAGETQLENTKLFALVSIAMADAAIAAWDSKYETSIDLWRPETAIREGETDSNPDTHPDDDWEPLSQDRDGNSFSPAFPAYVSGHATFGGAWAGIMESYFGSDNIAYVGTTEDPNRISTSRSFASFSEAASENADSRIYLGVHYQWDADAGLAVGRRIAGYIYANLLT